MIVGAWREASHLGSALFAPAFEKNGVIFGDDGNTILFEENFSAMVTKSAKADKIVFESWHDLAIADR